jgi:hypothetical protein
MSQIRFNGYHLSLVMRHPGERKFRQDWKDLSKRQEGARVTL